MSAVDARANILVVDDAGPVASLCVNVLRLHGYAAKGAHRSDAAVELLAREPFDLLIVDYKMPGMSGFQLLEHAKASSPRLLSILVTGHGTAEITEQAATLGFDAVLLKPFSSSELRETVARVLGTARGARHRLRS